MSENKVRLTNGQHWTAQQFLDHYFEPTASGTPTPVAGRPVPVDVDRSWYMGEGPGRYYHPGMFPIINQVANDRNLAAGSHDLAKIANSEDDLKAKISQYSTDTSSADYPLRAFVFGNESAVVSGKVDVGADGSKTFRKIEILPYDSNFDFRRNTWNLPLEGARGIARRVYDPENQGISYDIQYRGPGPNRGTGRIYDTFSDSQLNAALRKQFIYPRSGSPWLLSSVTGKPPLPFVEEQLLHLDRTNGAQAFRPNASAAAAPFASPVNRTESNNDVGSWLASLAGADPSEPTKSAPPLLDGGLGNFYRDDPAWLLQLRR